MSDPFVIPAASPISSTTPAEVEAPAVVPPLAHTPEQVQASDRVFTQEPRDTANLAGLFGLQSSVLLLHAVAVDTFSDDEEEEEEEAAPS